MVVPTTPGVLSAVGLLVSSIEHDRTETVALRVDAADTGELEAAFARLETHLSGLMADEGVPRDATRTTYLCDLRYVGQASTLEVPFESLADAEARFHREHDRIYGHATPGKPVELVNVRVVQMWQRPLPPLAAVATKPVGARPAYFEELGGFVETPVLQRAHLHESVEGPAIVEGADSTLVVYPGWDAVLDQAGNVIVTAR
jgi:N-methylhydantoinase A